MLTSASLLADSYKEQKMVFKASYALICAGGAYKYDFLC